MIFRHLGLAGRNRFTVKVYPAQLLVIGIFTGTHTARKKPYLPFCGVHLDHVCVRTQLPRVI